MKTLYNATKTIIGLKFLFFSIVKNLKTGKYCYYVRSPFSSNIGDSMIFKFSYRPMLLNKYTMTFLGILFTLGKYLLWYPIGCVIIPILIYFDGAKNFIKDRAWQDNVRYFNYANMVIIVGLTIWLILK
jgi:hypothetical protein